jgi:hypothetical protein
MPVTAQTGQKPRTESTLKRTRSQTGRRVLFLRGLAIAFNHIVASITMELGACVDYCSDNTLGAFRAKNVMHNGNTVNRFSFQ